MSLTDDLFRAKWAKRNVPAKHMPRFKEAIETWDKQNPTMAGTYNERMMEQVLNYVINGGQNNTPQNNPPAPPKQDPQQPKSI